MTHIFKIATILSFFILLSCNNNKGFYETKAIDELDKMSETIGELNSCSYSLDVTSMQIDNKTKVESDKNRMIHDVYMQGPAKFYIHSTGTRGRNSYWYDGQRFSFYSHDRNVFDTIRTTGNVIETIDFLNQKYGVYFPAADFFYPSLTDDIIDFADEVVLLENQTIDHHEYILIKAKNTKKEIIIWIDKSTKLPYKLIISPQTNEGLYYEAIFSNWKINPKFYDVLFDYQPSKDSQREPLKIKQ